jgi:hypothetical protein
MQCNHVPAKLSGLEQALADRVAAVNDLALLQLCQWVHTEYGIRVGVSTLWQTLARLGLSLKKNTPWLRANAPGHSESVVGMASPISPRRSCLVFLDETWTSTNMAPLRGRSSIGRRCIGHEPYGHWKTTNFVCALRCTGLVAPLVIDGEVYCQPWTLLF